jgi:membrane glycosyltransferase
VRASKRKKRILVGYTAFLIGVAVACTACGSWACASVLRRQGEVQDVNLQAVILWLFLQTAMVLFMCGAGRMLLTTATTRNRMNGILDLAEDLAP